MRPLGWVLIQWLRPYKKGTFGHRRRADIPGRRRPSAGSPRGHRKLREASWRRLSGPQEAPAPPTLGSQTSGLLDCQTVNACCLSRPACGVGHGRPGTPGRCRTQLMVRPAPFSAIRPQAPGPPRWGDPRPSPGVRGRFSVPVAPTVTPSPPALGSPAALTADFVPGISDFGDAPV